MSEDCQQFLSDRGRIHLRHENRRIDRAQRSLSAHELSVDQESVHSVPGGWQSKDSFGSSSVSTMYHEKGAPLYANIKASTDSINGTITVVAPVRQQKSRWQSLCVQGNSILGLVVSIRLYSRLWLHWGDLWLLTIF